MKERPILFSTPMVKAEQDGRKTHTRRVVRFPSELIGELCPYGVAGDRLWVRETWATMICYNSTPPRDLPHNLPIWYKDTYLDEPTGCGDDMGKWRSPIFLPRWASRITLEITNVRVERVKDISEGDAKKEGVEPLYQEPDEITNQALRSVGAEEVTQPYIIGWTNYQFKEDRRFRHIPKMSYPEWYSNPRDSFRSLWDSINDKRGYGWNANPWVWVIEFKKV